MKRKYRIAIYQNVAFGGAEMGIFNLTKHLKDEIALDLYTIDIDENIYDIYGYNKISLFESYSKIVEKHFKFKDQRLRIPKWLHRFSWRRWIN